MSRSLRDQCAVCLGITSGPISVRRDFMGYWSGFGPVSVAAQMQRLRFRQININVIRVGSDQFTADDMREIDAAIQFTRDTYARSGAVAVARVQLFDIPTVRALGREIIDNADEASTLTQEWTVPNFAVDVFFVRLYVSDTAGRSPVGGPCLKDAAGMTGVVVEMNAGGGLSDFALAHELGHYLGLSHVGRLDDPADSPNRDLLMFPSAPNGGNLRAADVATMSDHCFAFAGC